MSGGLRVAPKLTLPIDVAGESTGDPREEGRRRLSDVVELLEQLGSLRSLGLIDYPGPGLVVALPVLFMEGS